MELRPFGSGLGDCAGESLRMPGTEPSMLDDSSAAIPCHHYGDRESRRRKTRACHLVFPFGRGVPFENSSPGFGEATGNRHQQGTLHVALEALGDRGNKEVHPRRCSLGFFPNKGATREIACAM